MSGKKRVEIVFPCYNRREITLQCLRSLARIEKDGLDVHIIAVDDGSTDGTGDAIRTEFPDVEIFQGDGNLWFTAGTNRGVEAALKHDPDYVLCINDDAVFDSRFLKSMVECAEANKRSIVGSLLLLWDQPHRIFQVAPRWSTFYGGWRHWNQQTVWTIPQKPFEVDLIVGNCVLVPVAAIKECGLMDEKNFVNFGDAEWTPRMKKRGWRLFIEPRARVFCQPNTIAAKRLSGMSLKELYRVLWTDSRNQHNLRCRFISYWVGAPTKIQAVVGFGVFVTRLALKTVGLNKNWQCDEKDERKLSEEYA